MSGTSPDSSWTWTSDSKFSEPTYVAIIPVSSVNLSNTIWIAWPSGPSVAGAPNTRTSSPSKLPPPHAAAIKAKARRDSPKIDFLIIYLPYIYVRMLKIRITFSYYLEYWIYSRFL